MRAPKSSQAPSTTAGSSPQAQRRQGDHSRKIALPVEPGEGEPDERCDSHPDYAAYGAHATPTDHQRDAGSEEARTREPDDQ